MRVQSLSVNEAVFHSSLEDADVGIHTHLTSLIVQILHSIQANIVRPYKDAFSIFTARKRSLRRLSFYRCLSVHRVGVHGTHTPPPQQAHLPWACMLPLWAHKPLGTQAPQACTPLACTLPPPRAGR